jgi:hypothetical protein
MENWNIVYVSGQQHLAELAKQKLFENGIDAVVLNKKDSVYLIGHFEVMVEQQYLPEAEKIMKDFGP